MGDLPSLRTGKFEETGGIRRTLNMKDEVRQVLGRTISGVIVKDRDKHPKSQVFLLFTDGTYYEFYGDYISGTGGVNRGDRQAVLQYMPSGKVVFDVHLEK